MKIFHCDHCGQLIFFENVRCVRCQHPLAYLPDLGVVGSLEPVGPWQWRCPLKRAEGRTYRLCQNYERENVCNWAIPGHDGDALCQSCRLTRVIPDLSRPGHKAAWYRLEVAKRRLVYSLLTLGLPLANHREDPERGLAFEFLADPDDPEAPRVLTGHSEGLITINIAEADDAERERRRLQMGEPYRTLVGHFRHESGHYYWDRLIRDSDRLDLFRGLFGDDRQDYAQSLQRHHNDGPPPSWQGQFISAYASAHPWEDWAETWAHYLHMADALETAATCGLNLVPSRPDEPSLQPNPPIEGGRLGSFDKMISNWFALTYVLNNLNRGLGLPDGYPFVLSPPVVEKLRFVHHTIDAA